MNNDLLLVFLIIILVWFFFKSRTEKFDASTLAFVPVGYDRYGLRGDLLRRSSIDNIYISPNRHIALHAGGGQMWESNTPPPQDGMIGCKKTGCPTNTNEYDQRDTCWSCPTQYRPKPIPDIHPHVPN